MMKKTRNMRLDIIAEIANARKEIVMRFNNLIETVHFISERNIEFFEMTKDKS